MSGVTKIEGQRVILKFEDKLIVSGKYRPGADVTI